MALMVIDFDNQIAFNFENFESIDLILIATHYIRWKMIFEIKCIPYKKGFKSHLYNAIIDKS